MDYRPAVDLRSTFSPNLREVSTFFLGAVFWCSLQCFGSSPLIRTLLRKLGALFTLCHNGSKPSTPLFDTEALQSREKHITSTQAHMAAALNHRQDRSNLLLIFSFCFILASLGDFLSLITYGLDADTVCAFAVAWGDMSAHSARLIALFILRSELKHLGMKTLELILYLGWMLIGIGLLFATNAINIGITSPMVALHLSTCTRRLYLPVALSSSLFHVVFNVYVLVRMSMLILNGSSRQPLRYRLTSLLDVRVAQAFSLFVLEALIVTPMLAFDPVPDFIPFSIGAIFVLLTFHYRSSSARAPTLGSSVDSPIARINISPLKTRAAAPSLPPVSVSDCPIDAGDFGAIHGFSVNTSIPAGPADALSPPRSSGKDRGRQSPLLTPPGLRHEAGVSVGIRSPNSTDDADSRLSDRSSPMGRVILPSQVEFAKQFEQDTALGVPPRRRPDISIDIVSPTIDRDDVSHVGSTRTLSSAVYGSDIIMYTPTSKRKQDRMKRWSGGSRSMRSSPRDSASTSATGGSLVPPYSATSSRTQELPPLYAGKKKAFGSQSLRRAASKLAAVKASAEKSPRGLPAHPRSERDSFGNVQGAQPPPPPLSSARSLQRLTTTTTSSQGDVLYVPGRGRSGSQPSGPRSQAGEGSEDGQMPSAY
ncbi:hypothetical protein OE88DRAFT_1652451 [Heliocybe sulcata]|uniref:Uncharacterized protein n=1 Tax=Heliocybe sulcata TaxID=5364 RepID=A0A5C3NEY3_9AGAM|nr:hypothetical protein OE88DRAFT_1652451 [Heliocybe sulcata]